MHWRNWLRRPEQKEKEKGDPHLREKQVLYDELQDARVQWQHAVQKLDYVTDHDQIDYVIYSMEAAEKRYEMLLKNAKRMNIHILRDNLGKTAEG